MTYIYPPRTRWWVITTRLASLSGQLKLLDTWSQQWTHRTGVVSSCVISLRKANMGLVCQVSWCLMIANHIDVCVLGMYVCVCVYFPPTKMPKMSNVEYDNTQHRYQISRGGFPWILVGRITVGQIISPSNHARLYWRRRFHPQIHVRSGRTIFTLPAFCVLCLRSLKQQLLLEEHLWIWTKSFACVRIFEALYLRVSQERLKSN